MDIATISKLIDAGFTAQEIRTFASADTGAGAITTAPAATPAGAAPNSGNTGTGTSAGTGNSARSCTSAAACSGAEATANDAAELAKTLKQMQENLQKQQTEPIQAAQNPDGQTMRDLLGAIRNLNTTIQAGAILNSNMPPLKSDADIAAGGLANILNPFADKQNGGN